MRLETPFKCYIYETQALYKGSGGCLFNGRGKVIGEFICNEIINIFADEHIAYFHKTCLTNNEFYKYCGGLPCVKGWHISDLVIYDEPKELSEFHKVGYTETKESVSWLTREEENSWQIKRPPQSWFYVEGKSAGILYKGVIQMNKTDWEMALSVLENLEKEQNTPHILCGICFAKAAVEKQIPYNCGSIVGKCKCGKAVYPHMKNCSACGQALDWSDTE